MPTLFTIFGLRFFFYSDEHLPIHIHVENADGRIKINMEPTIRLVYNKNMKMNDVKRALTLAELYTDEIINKWNEFHS